MATKTVAHKGETFSSAPEALAAGVPVNRIADTFGVPLICVQHTRAQSGSYTGKGKMKDWFKKAHARWAASGKVVCACSKLKTRKRAARKNA